MKLLKGLSSIRGTKRALIASAACTLLCGLLLFSTSIAWFTANKESSVNELYSGNLDIELSYSKTMDNNDWHDVKDAADIFKVNGENMLWEPGAVNVVYFKVENKGSLAAKYDFAVVIDSEIGGTNFKDEPFKLSDYIKGGVKEVNNAFAGETENDRRTAAISAIESTAKKLSEINGAPLITDQMSGTTENPNEKIFALVLYMPADAGDVTNYKTGTEQPKVSLKVKLVATQDVGEADSFGTDYDKYAVNPTVSSPSALTNALTNAENGEVIGIGGNDLELTQKLDVNKNVTIVGDGEHCIIGNAQTKNDEGTFDVLKITNGATVQNLKIKSRENVGTSYAYALYPTGGDLVVNKCDITYGRAIYATNTNGKLIVNDSVLNGTYPLNTGAKLSEIKVTNTKLYGWTSYSNSNDINGTVTFTNCEFGKGVTGYAFFKPYTSTTLTNCTFSAEFLDGHNGGNYYGICSGDNVSGSTYNFVDCYVMKDSVKTALTADLLNQMFNTVENGTIPNNTWQINGVAVTPTITPGA